MKKILILLLIATFSCSPPEDECEELYIQYTDAISDQEDCPSCVELVYKEYLEKKTSLGCN